MTGQKLILVTGISGLIGGLVGRSLSKRYKVRGLDRRPTDWADSVQADVADMDRRGCASRKQTMSEAPVLFERDASVGIVRLNRPQAMNALTKEMMLSLMHIAIECDEDPDIRAVILTGAGDAFNAGLAVALTEGKGMKEAIQFANAVGGLSATKIGTAKSMPLRSEIDNLL